MGYLVCVLSERVDQNEFSLSRSTSRCDLTRRPLEPVLHPEMGTVTIGTLPVVWVMGIVDVTYQL